MQPQNKLFYNDPFYNNPFYNKQQWQKIYDDTPVCADYIYLDTAAAAPPPLPVLNAVTDYLHKTACLGTYLPSFRRQVYQDLQCIRQKMADFIGAQATEVSFTPNGTAAICLLAQGIDWQAGDEIILPDTEMLSNIAIWQLIAAEKGLKIHRLAADAQGIIQPESLLPLLNARTRLISFVALSNVTGAIQPVAALCALAAQHKVLTHVSASQALAMLDINVQHWQCDFLSACGRKGLRAIEGSGILYSRQPLLSRLTPVLAGWWNSHIDPHTDQLTFADDGKRLEAGCPNVPAIYSLGAALDYASQLGVPQIHQRVAALTRYAVDALSSVPGVVLYGPQNASQRLGIIPFTIQGIAADNLTRYLEQQHIIIESGHFMATPLLQRYRIDKIARLSLHYFNRETEIDRLVNCLQDFITSQQR